MYSLFIDLSMNENLVKATSTLSLPDSFHASTKTILVMPFVCDIKRLLSKALLPSLYCISCLMQNLEDVYGNF